MKKIFAACFLTGMLYSCMNTPPAPEAVALPIPDEMTTLKMQQKLKDQYDNVWDFSEGYVGILKDGKWGFADTSGKVVIPLQFESPSQFHHGYAPVIKNGKAGVIDTIGKAVVPFVYDYVGDYQDGVFSARNFQKKYGFIDSANNIVIPFDYDEVSIAWFSGGLAIMKKGNKYGAVDKTNKIIVPFVYDELGINDGFEKGYVRGKLADKNLLVDKTGQIINLPGIDNYETIQPIEGNLFIVKEKTSGLEGMIDLTGKVVIPIQYISVTNFYKDLAVVETTNGKFLLKSNGVTYFEQTPFLDLTVLKENLFYGNTKADDMMYLFDITGKHVVEEGYDNIIPMVENLLLVNRDKKAWYINYKGEKIADLPE